MELKQKDRSTPLPFLLAYLSASGCCTQLMILPTLISNACNCAISASVISPVAAAAAAAAAVSVASSLLLVTLLLSMLLTLLLAVLSAPVLILGTRTKPPCIAGT
jgi:hypothetical protein